MKGSTYAFRRIRCASFTNDLTISTGNYHAKPSKVKNLRIRVFTMQENSTQVTEFNTNRTEMGLASLRQKKNFDC